MRRWLSTIVIGLELCPFAKRVFEGELIRYIVSNVAEREALRSQLAEELKTLATSPVESIETSLLIHPRVLERFEDYCDFLAEAEQLIKRLGYRGVIQIASFHPEYQFAGTEPDAIENYTNRSPFPMLHLLREESITKAAASGADLLQVPRRNVALLRQLGRDHLLNLLKTVPASQAP